MESAKPAEQVAADGPIPLFPPLPPSEPFPINTLGPLLSRAADDAISRKVQVPEAIAAQLGLAGAPMTQQMTRPKGDARGITLFT